MNNYENLAVVISNVILTDKKGIIKLLLQNGHIFEYETISDNDLVTMIMNSLSDSQKFRESFQKYLELKINNTSYSNSNGGSDGFGGGGSFFSGFNASAAVELLSTGLGFISGNNASNDARAAAEAQAKAQIALANAQASNNQTALQIAQLQLEAAKVKPATNNTLLYVGIGVAAVVVLGIGIFAVTRK